MSRRGAESTSDALLRVLGGLLIEIHEAPDLRHILDRILEEAIRLVNADRGDFVMSNAKGELKIAVVRGPTSHPLKPGVLCPKESFIHYVYQHKDKTAHRADVESLRRKKRYHPSHNKSKSEAAVRLEFKGRGLGVLNVESESISAFTAEDGQTLERLADYAAIAVKVFEEERGLRELAAKVLTKRDDTNHEKLEETLGEILEGVEEVLGLNRGLIYVISRDKSRLDVCGWRVKRRPPEGFFHSLSDNSFACEIYQTGAEFCEDVRTDKRVSAKGRKKFNIKGSLVGFPLTFGGERVGVMVAWSDRPPYPVEEDALRLTPIATLAAWKVGVWLSDQNRKKTQKIQSEQMEAFEALVKNQHVCIFRKNSQCKFTYANQEFVEHLEQESDATVINGQDDFDFYRPEFATEYQVADRRVMDTGELVNINERNQLKWSDKLRKVEGFKARIIDPKTGEKGVQGIFWDVTKRQQVLEQKNALLDLMQTVLKSALTDRGVDAFEEVKHHLVELSRLLQLPKNGVNGKARRNGQHAVPAVRQVERPRPRAKRTAVGARAETDLAAEQIDQVGKTRLHPRSPNCKAVLRAIRSIFEDIGLSRQQIKEVVQRNNPDLEIGSLGHLLAQLEEDGFVLHEGNTSAARWTPTAKGRAWKQATAPASTPG